MRTKQLNRKYNQRQRLKRAGDTSKLLPCFICGELFKKPCGHAVQYHGITAREYKEKFGLDRKGGILTKESREKIRQATRENGTIDNLKNGEVYRFKKGNKKMNYKRSKQTLERLKASQWVGQKKDLEKEYKKIYNES